VNVEVLFEGEGYLAVNKPPGVLVILGRGESTAPVLQEELEKARQAKLWVVHRLDRDTSGVLLFATHAKAHRALSMAFESGHVEKRYLALVEGRIEKPLDINVALVPARRGKMRPARPKESGKEARTLVRPLEVFTKTTLVEAVPLTGRTHQIRVHLRWAGHPLLFDHQYGAHEPIRDSEGNEILSRTPLHAASVRLPPLESIQAREITAPLPLDMKSVVLARIAAGDKPPPYDSRP
jgi:RluA family pseudouridine synthase